MGIIVEHKMLIVLSKYEPQEDLEFAGSWSTLNAVTKGPKASRGRT